MLPGLQVEPAAGEVVREQPVGEVEALEHGNLNAVVLQPFAEDDHVNAALEPVKAPVCTNRGHGAVDERERLLDE